LCVVELDDEELDWDEDEPPAAEAELVDLVELSEEAVVVMLSEDEVDAVVALELPVAVELEAVGVWVEAQETAVGTLTPAVSQSWSAKVIVARRRQRETRMVGFHV